MGEAQAQNVEQMIGEAEAGELMRDLLGVNGRAQLAVAALEALALVVCQHRLKLCAQALEARLEARDRLAERHVRLQSGDRPSAGPPRGALQREQSGQFRLRALVAGAGAQSLGLIDQLEHAFGEDPGPDGVLGARAVAARKAEDEARAHQVDQFVD